MTTTTFFATAPKGVETLLAEELRGLGLQDVKETRAGAHFSGSLKDAYTACLWSRVANRILMPIVQFEANDTDALYENVKQIAWSEHLSIEQTLAVDASVSNSNITHSQYAALKTKDAIVDYFRDLCGDRPSIETQRPDLQINIYINNNQAQLAIDLSGESLHVRAYRSRGSAAPLKENLAAAILYRAKWPEIAKEGGAFTDFMCGSGTLPIEAALMACDIAPGIYRDYFGFLGWKQHNSDMWQEILDDAMRRKIEGMKTPPVIFGMDHHQRTLEKADQHVLQAGLEDIVKISYQDVMNFNVGKTEFDFPKKGLVVLNPPYGLRLSQKDAIQELYEGIGRVLKGHFLGWKASIFTDEKENGKWLGIRSHKIHSLFNGALPCKLLHFDIIDEEIFKSHRLPRKVPADELSEQSLGFRNRFTKNLKQSLRWAKQEDITCFRVYDADLPDYSVAIDLYHSVVAKEDNEDKETQLWANIQEYEAPKTIDPIKAKFRLREIVSIVGEVLEIDDQYLILKNRRRQKGKAQYEKVSDEKNFHEVHEGACRFWVNFEDYLDTGLFLDHRPIRTVIQEQSQGKSVLNLFAYSGAITVHAAKGGASNTLTIDMSNTYISWAQRNMKLNGFVDAKHEYLSADCLAWLKQPSTKNKFDIIFLDPPSFSNSKRMDNFFDVQKDHVTIIQGAMNCLSEGGVLYFSTNLRGFKLDQASLSQLDVNDISAESIPRDFKQKAHVHKCWEIKTCA
jgi:23S rRNA (guanine2445-N2)-methyltransferase / 23S rRNA (guanine2069-N7)-methyltransferase